VDVIGSPTLTGLIGALTIEECEDVPFLDLDPPATELGEGQYGGYSSSIVSKVLAPLGLVGFPSAAGLLKSNQGRNLGWLLSPSPLNELYPFT
jgi:hypothetical protein